MADFSSAARSQIRNAVLCGLLALSAAASLAATATAGPRAAFFSPGLAPRAPEVMLYFNHRIGAVGTLRPTFGLRVQQVRQASNTGDPDGGDSMQHREWINWQMEAHSNLHISALRIQLGGRLTYDVTNRRLGSPARSGMQIGSPTARSGSLNGLQLKQPFARGINSATATHDSGRGEVRDNLSVRETGVAATAAATTVLPPARRFAGSVGNNKIMNVRSIAHASTPLAPK